jgi:hypothetical protein
MHKEEPKELTFPVRSRLLDFLTAVSLTLCVGISPSLSAEVTRVGIVEDSESLEHNVVLGLQRSGLHDLAIAFCERAIAAAKHDPIRAAKRRVWLLEATVERDARTASTISKAIESTEALRDKFIDSNSKTLDGLWVNYHVERLRFVLANRAVALYQSTPANPGPRDDALQSLRTLADRCEMLLGQLADLPLGNLANPKTDVKQLARDAAGLRNRLRLLKIDGMLSRSQCYPVASDDAIAASTEALAGIDELRNQLESDWGGRDELEFTRFRCLVAANQGADALSELPTWLKTLNNDAILDQAVALVATIHLRAGRNDEAKAWLGRAKSTAASPDIALLAMQIRIAEWQEKQANEQSKPEELQRELDSILAMKKLIAEKHGSYWENRCEAAIVASGQKSPDKPAVIPRPSYDLIQLEISQLIRAKNLPSAVNRLDQAELLANSDNNLDKAFGFAKIAIGLLQQEAQERSSLSATSAWIERASERSVRYASQKDADRLHLAAIESWPSELVESYESKLLEHLTIWAESETTTLVRRKLVLWCMKTGNVSLLVEAWLAIPRMLGHEEGISAFAMMTMQRRQPISTAKPETGDNPNDLSGRLQSLVDRDRLPMNAARVAEWLTADFDAWPIDNGISRLSGKHLGWSLASEETPSEMINIAKYFKAILESSMQPRLNIPQATEAKQAIEAWFREDTVGRIGAMVVLNLQLSNILRLRSARPGEEKEFLGLVELVISCQEACSNELARLKSTLHLSIYSILESANQIVMYRLSGLSGKWQESTAWFEMKSKESPRESMWLMELARLLENQSTAEIERALNLYRKLANSSALGTNDWFEARFSTLRCLRKLNRSGEADKFLATMQAMVPNPSSVWQQRMVGASIIKP